MATTHDPSSDPFRGPLLAALLVLGGTTGAAFARVFAGAAPAVRLVGAGAAAILVAALLRRRHLLISLAVSAAALLVVIGVLVFRDTTWAALPTPRTVEAIGRAWDRLGTDAIREVAPAPALPSLFTAALVAVWTAATAAHALAVRARSPVLALLPGAALLAFAGVVTEDGPRPGYAAAFVLAAAAVLFGTTLARIGLWGPLVARPHRRGIGRTTGRWARGLALAATAVGLVLPDVLPGYSSGALLNLEPGGGGPVTINPVVDIRPSLLRNPPTELFRVEARHASYWRLLVLDRFTGRQWTSSDLLARDGVVVQGSDLLPGARSPGGDILRHTVEIGQLSSPWLPAAFQPVQVGLPVAAEGSSARFDTASQILARNVSTEDGYRYSVTSQILAPSPRALDRASQALGPGEPLAAYLELPENLPRAVTGLARRIASGQPTPYREALAIQEYLRGFTYDERAPAGHGVNDILNFLETKRGYCEQFAGTMAVMLRALGIPSRVALGFQPGTRGADGRFMVTSKQTHAWVEIYFPVFGWLAFEPTPTRFNPTAEPYLSPGPATLGGPGFLTGPREAAVLGPKNNAGFGQQGNEALNSDPQERPEAAPAAPAAPERRWPVVLLLALGLLAIAALIFTAKVTARRALLVRARTPRENALAAFRVFQAEAADLGFGRRRSETLSEYAGRLGGAAPVGADRAERLARVTRSAAYSPSGPPPTDAAQAPALARSLGRDLRRHAGLGRTVLGAIRPSAPV